MNHTIVIHHSADFDGLFCREIARKHFGENATYIGWDYGDSLPEIPLGATVYMLDISVEGLMNHPSLIWIDHHKSAIEKYPNEMPGIRIDGVAACRLAWQYFFGDTEASKEDYVNRLISEPLTVRLAGEYDIWDKRDLRAELFQHGLRSCDLTHHWGLLLSLSEKPEVSKLDLAESTGFPLELESDGSEIPAIVHALLRNGEAVQYAKTEENRGIITSYGFDVTLEGLRFLACNHARFNSHLFTAGIREDHDALLGFNWSGKEWRVSLYGAPGKPDIDLSKIAVKYGGGGHKQACGFKCTDLPFSLQSSI